MKLVLVLRLPVCEIKDDDIIEYVIKPEDFGFERCSKDDLVGGDPSFNAKITIQF